MHKIIWHHSKKAAKHTVKKTGHFLVPWLVHYLTDKYEDRHHHVVVDSIFGMVIIMMIAVNIGLGYWFFGLTTPAELNISVNTPAYIISGSEMTYYINYHNISRDVKNVSFKIVPPKGFTFKDANLEKAEEEIFYLGDLKKYKFGELKITGDIIGNINQKQNFIVITDYYYHGQKFSEMTTHNYQIHDSSFEVVTELPESILNNQEFEWTIHYKNNSDLERENTKFSLDLPDNLNVIEAPAGFDKNTDEVELKTVSGREESDLTFKGIFSKAVGESNTLIGVNGMFSLDDINYLQSQAFDSVRVLTPRLSIGSSAPFSAYIGHSFTYAINVNNIGDADLTNVKVAARLNGVQGLGIYANGGAVSGSDANWLIDKLAPGETKNVYLTIAAPENLRQENLSVSLSSQAMADIEDSSISTYTETSNATVRYNSTLDFNVEGRYYDLEGAQIGYGPYPLEADEITALRVFWNVSDFTNDLNNISISTTLPSQVEWTGYTAVSQGANISYDEETRKVTWTTFSIPAFSGPQGASFEVRVWPNVEQIDKNINITNETDFFAKDSFTSTNITKRLAPLRTKEEIKELED